MAEPRSGRPDVTIGYEPVAGAAPSANGKAAAPTPTPSRNGPPTPPPSAPPSTDPTRTAAGSGTPDDGEPEVFIPDEALIGPYAIVDEIGRGGMGVVYKARHKTLNRIVALKMILAGTGRSEVLKERFQIEAEAVARVHHPGIVQVYDIGMHNCLPYLALELVDGGTLADRIDGKPQNARYAAEVVEAMARAMTAAHAMNVIHRDLKPGNVLMTRENQPKITDFGLAKDLDREAAQTRTGSILGTPAYMSPEQAAGRVHDIGPATDIYAMGAILYEMLTGRPPHRGETAIDTIRQVLDHETVPPRQLLPKLPRDLDTICLKALQKVPAKRYASSAEMADDLTRFLQGEPIKARPIGIPERVVKWVRRSPAFAALSVGGAVAFVAFITLAVYSYLEIARRAEQAEIARKEADRALVESNRRMVRLNVANGTQQMDDGDYLSAVLWFAEALRLEPPDSPRVPMHRLRLQAVLDLCPRLAQVWLHEGPLTDAGFDAQGRFVLTAGDDGMARVWDTAAAAPVGPPLEHGGPVKHAVLSPDGQSAVTAGADGLLKVWDVKTARPRWVKNLGTPASCLAYAPSGRYLVAGGNGRLWVWDTTHPRDDAAFTETAFTDRVTAVGFSADGRRFAAACMDGTARVYAADGKVAPAAVLKHDKSAPVLAAALNADGTRVLTGAQDGTAVIWDTATGQPALPTPLRHTGPVRAVGFGPDGRRVLTGGDDRAARVWDAATAQQVGRAIQHAGAVLHAGFSPSGQQVVTGSDDNTVRVWDAESGLPVSPPFRSSAVPVAARFSPNGFQVLAASQSRVARLWTLITPAETQAADEPGAAPATRPVGLQTVDSPDGRKCVTFGGDQQVKIRYTTADRSPVGAPLQTGARMSAAAFSSDSRVLITGDEEGGVMLWDAETGLPVWRSPARHASRVLRVLFSPDGKAVATTSDDSTACVWSAANGEALVPLIRLGAGVYDIRFTLGGEGLVTRFPDGRVRAWDATTGEPLTPLLSGRLGWEPKPLGAEWTIDDLLSLGRVLAGVHLSEAGGLLPLDVTTLRAEWVQLKTGHPAGFSADGKEIDAWLQSRARACEAEARWFAAAWFLDRLAGADDDPEIRQRLAVAAANLKDWAKAAADASRAIRLNPESPDIWFQRAAALSQLGQLGRAATDFAKAVELRTDPVYAPIGLAARVRLEANDQEGYRKACRELVEKYGPTDDPRIAARVAWVCSLGPDGVTEPMAVLRLSDKAVSADPTDTAAAQAHAAALFRAGRFDEAGKILAPVAARGDRPQAWGLKALIAKKTLSPDATEFREKARVWRDANPAAGALGGPVPPSWDIQMEVDALLREYGSP